MTPRRIHTLANKCRKFGVYFSVSVKSDAQNFEELIHLDNQPVAKGSLGDATEDLLNSNANEDAPPPTSPLHAFEENNTIAQDNITTTQQGKVPSSLWTDRQKRHKWKLYLPANYVLLELALRFTLLSLVTLGNLGSCFFFHVGINCNCL